MKSKKRDFDNPIQVNLQLGERVVGVEVCAYEVNATHLILSKKLGEFREKKWIRLDALTSFSVNEPSSYVQPVVQVPFAVPSGYPPGQPMPTTVIHAVPQAEEGVINHPILGRIDKKRQARGVGVQSSVNTEEELSKNALTGKGPVAGFVDNV